MITVLFTILHGFMVRVDFENIKFMCFGLTLDRSKLKLLYVTQSKDNYTSYILLWKYATMTLFKKNLNQNC